MAGKLTEAEWRDLEAAARWNGVFQIKCPRGLRYSSKERSAQKMVAMGLLEPSPYGDWYVTPAGRDALAQPAERGEATP